MNRYLAERRRFLKLVGATALTYPFLRGVPSFAAGPATGTTPMYVVFLYTSCGCVRPLWGAYGPPPTGSAAAVTPLSGSAPDGGVGGFRPTLAAFEAAGLTNQVNVLDGLNNAAANGGTHEAGMASLWTAGPLASDAQHATGQSIDQAINTALLAQGVKTSQNPLALYAVSNCDEQARGVHNRMSYYPYSPSLGYSDYFDPISVPSGTATSAMNLLFPTMMQSDAGADPSPIIRAQVQKQVNTELTALASRLCSDDSAQLKLLQSMWNSADTQLSSQAMAAASCMQPTFASPQPAGDPFGNACGVNDPLPWNITAMSTILSMALACDLTRVASLQFSQALSPTVHTWLPNQTSTHHVYSHQGPTSFNQFITCMGPPAGCGTDALYQVPPSEVTNFYPQQLCDIDAFYAKQVAAFAKMLSALPAPNGNSSQSLLDYTVICWGSELDMGAYHNHDDTPFVLIGGAGSGKIKTGQLVRFPLNLGGPGAVYSTPGNRPPTNNRFHNDLLVTLAQIMGVGSMIPTFGATSIPGMNFQSSSPLTLNQGVIQEILPT
jgi:hypothetical protein